MQTSLLFIAAVLFCGAVHGADYNEIHQDLQDIIDVIPKDEVNDIVVEHYLHDSDFQDTVQYLRSHEFYRILDQVREEYATKALVDDLELHGFNVQDAINQFNDLLGLPNLIPPSTNIQVRTLKTLVDEILAVVPMAEFLSVYQQKLEAHGDFARLIAHVQTDGFKELFTAFRALQDVKTLEEKLAQHEIYVDEVIVFIKNILDWR